MGSPPPPREYLSRTSLPGNQLASSAARRFVRAVLAEWAAQGAPAVSAVTERFVDDAVLLASELVTAAVMRTGTTVDLVCRWEWHNGPTGLVVDVAGHHASPESAESPDHAEPYGHDDTGPGLRLVRALADSWGVTYRRCSKSVWFRLDTRGAVTSSGAHGGGAGDGEGGGQELRVARILSPVPPRTRNCGSQWVNQGSLSFLAEASDLLAGQLDEDMIASLAAQMLVPRLADWCAVWLTGDSDGMRLSRVWHTDEERNDTLRLVLEKDPPSRPALGPATGLLRPEGFPWPWPSNPEGFDPGGYALACPLVNGGRCHGLLVIGRAGLLRLPDEAVRLVEDLSRRVAMAVGTARRYSREAMISRVLQLGLAPAAVTRIPGVETAVVYEPTGEGFHVGGDFYDLFPVGDGRWCFALGDVCGNGPEAAAVTGLARHVVRLLAREGYGVAGVLDRLNRSLVEESAENGLGGEGPRFLSLLYGELVPSRDSGAMCTLASAGHPLPLLLRGDGAVEPVAAPQMLLGITEEAQYAAETFELAAGDTLLCVTDGVTERRHGDRQLDDDDGLHALLGACAGLDAQAVAERIRQEVHAFDADPLSDDLAVMVLQAVPTS
ncbi:hypothetical protein GCM10012280_03430 [Wenjunlia tyrosinilytica]|uniref:PPM-type phosphatase domain-containing protein n=1 Tax=Wenjunlia tyrosinilytica TaxID=1544741 RepID=A0A918DSP2_9ACTN|nr:SpoIIE family protein phosphatase [Wenjunlia tyrosinilytica]GGO80760.1 hypothetical protein GCM10012280_03430 [Wenjunlia tyrosinilytica]